MRNIIILFVLLLVSCGGKAATQLDPFDPAGLWRIPNVEDERGYTDWLIEGQGTDYFVTPYPDEGGGHFVMSLNGRHFELLWIGEHVATGRGNFIGEQMVGTLYDPERELDFTATRL